LYPSDLGFVFNLPQPIRPTIESVGGNLKAYENAFWDYSEKMNVWRDQETEAKNEFFVKWLEANPNSVVAYDREGQPFIFKESERPYISFPPDLYQLSSLPPKPFDPETGLGSISFLINLKNETQIDSGHVPNSVLGWIRGQIIELEGRKIFVIDEIQSDAVQRSQKLLRNALKHLEESQIVKIARSDDTSDSDYIPDVDGLGQETNPLQTSINVTLETKTGERWIQSFGFDELPNYLKVNPELDPTKAHDILKSEITRIYAAEHFVPFSDEWVSMATRTAIREAKKKGVEGIFLVDGMTSMANQMHFSQSPKKDGLPINASGQNAFYNVTVPNSLKKTLGGQEGVQMVLPFEHQHAMQENWDKVSGRFFDIRERSHNEQDSFNQFATVFERLSKLAGLDEEHHNMLLKSANLLRRMIPRNASETGEILHKAGFEGIKLGATEATFKKALVVFMGLSRRANLTQQEHVDILNFVYSHEYIGHVAESLSRRGQFDKKIQKINDDFLNWSEHATPEELEATQQLFIDNFLNDRYLKIPEIVNGLKATTPSEVRANLAAIWAAGQLDGKFKPTADLLTHAPRPVFNFFKTIINHVKKLFSTLFKTAKATGSRNEGFEKGLKYFEALKKEADKAQEVFDQEERFEGMGMHQILDSDIDSMVGVSEFPVLKEVYSGVRGAVGGFADLFLRGIDYYGNMDPDMKPIAGSVLDHNAGVRSDTMWVQAPFMEGVTEMGTFAARKGGQADRDYKRMVGNEKVRRVVNEALKKSTQRGGLVNLEEEGNTDLGKIFRALKADDQRLAKEKLPQFQESVAKVHEVVVRSMILRAVYTVVSYLQGTFNGKLPLSEITAMAEMLVHTRLAAQDPEMAAIRGDLKVGDLLDKFVGLNAEKLHGKALALADRLVEQRMKLKKMFETEKLFFSIGDFGKEINWNTRDLLGRMSERLEGMLTQMEKERGSFIDGLTELDPRVREEMKSQFRVQEEIQRLLTLDQIEKTPRRGERSFEGELDLVDAHRRYAHLLVGLSHTQVMDAKLNVFFNNPKLKGKEALTEKLKVLIQNYKIPDTGVQRALTKGAFVHLMGLSLPNHVAELAQPVFMMLPQMQSLGFKYSDSLGMITRAAKMAGDAYLRSFKKGVKDGDESMWDGMFEGQKQKEWKQLAAEAAPAGWLTMTHVSDAMEEGTRLDDFAHMAAWNPKALLGKAGKGVAKVYQSYAGLSSMLYRQFTQQNNRLGLLVAFEMAKKKFGDRPFLVKDPLGRSKVKVDREVFEYIRSFMNSTLLNTGRAGRADLLFRTKNPLARTAGTMMSLLQTYTRGWMNMVGGFYEKGFHGRKYGLTETEVWNNRRALFTMGTTQLLGAGLLGMPFVAAVLELMEQQLGVDLKAELSKGLSRLFNEDEAEGGVMTEFVERGLINAIFHESPISPDMGSRFGIGGVLGLNAFDGFSTQSLFGPATSIMQDILDGGKFAMEGRFGQAVGEVLPVGLKKPWMMARGKGNVVDAYGNVEMKLSDPERLMYSLGFTPQRLRKQREATAVLRAGQEASKRATSQMWDKLTDEFLKKGPEEVRWKLQQIEKESKGNYSAKMGAAKIAERVVKRQYPKDLRSDPSLASSERVEDYLRTMDFDMVQPSNMERLQLERQVLAMLGQERPLTEQELAEAMAIDQMQQERPWTTKQRAKSLYRQRAAEGIF